MKRVVKITESQLNDMIKKVMTEQEGQVMNTGPSPEQMVGSADGETDAAPHAEEGPNFEEFVNCAKELMAQDVTVGNLVDQILEDQNEPEAEEPMGEPTPEAEGGLEPEVPMA